MEQALQFTGLCVVGALLALTVRRGSPETALLLSIAAIVLVALGLADSMGQVLSFLKELGERSGVPDQLFLPIYKTVGIALVVRVGGSLCRDTGESALAAAVETAGAVCALVTALPLLRAALDLLMELMG